MYEVFRKLTRVFRRPNDPSGYVYYAKLSAPQGVFYKLGYTKKSSLRERLAYAGLGDEQLIEREFVFAFHDDACSIERLAGSARTLHSRSPDEDSQSCLKSTSSASMKHSIASRTGSCKH